MLETKNLLKTYKPKKGVPVTALNNVSIKFPEKGMVFLLGKSGSGKSTLLNLLGGLDSYNGGEIIIKGVSSKSFRQKHFDSYRNTYVGFIFQEYNVLDEFTVGANIALAIELQNRKASDDEINNILKEVDLAGYGSRKPNELSGGQKQRVAIARALVKNPQIIMADEPTGALDSNTGKQVFDTLKRLSENKLVIVVSHDRDFAEKYADRIIELSDGSVISDVECAPTGSEVKTEESGITYNGNTVEISGDYRLTEQDRIDINNYIEALHSGKLALNYTKSNSSNRFAKTDESKITITDKTPFKLIKSKLPLKSSFKIGASGLKYKKIRLVFTILLSCVSFGLFGLADTFGSYNHIDTCTNSLFDSNVKYIATAKSKQIKSDGYSYWRNYGYKISENDLEDIEKAVGVKMHGVYCPIGAGLDFFEHIDPETKFTETDYNIYYSSFTGFAAVDESTLADMGLSIVAGRLPDGNSNEIAISEYMLELFKLGKYTDGTTIKDKNGNETVKYESINTPQDIIGRTLVLDGSKYTVTAVINTGLDFERYRPLTVAKKQMSTSEEIISYALLREFDTAYQYSYTGAVMVGKELLNRLISERPPVSEITEGYLSLHTDDGDFVDPQYLARLSDVKDEKIIWVNGVKSVLGEKEIVVSADAMYLKSGMNAESCLLEDGTDELLSELKKLDLYASLNIFDNDEYSYENGYRVVGIIDTRNTENNKTKLTSAVICNDNLFSQLADGKENYYDFCVGSAPKEKSRLKEVVSYCYREDSDLRYEIQNSVTYELDSVNEVLKSLSKIFLYIGIGFALFAALMLSNFIGTSISYKKQEIGILRAIGSRSNDVFRIFFSESFIIAMINFVLSGIGVGVVTAIINYYVRHSLGVLVTVLNFGIRQILLLAAVSLLVAFVASYIPVKRVAFKKPIDAIRDR